MAKWTAAEVRQLQHDLNAFTNKHLLGVAPLIVDGQRGHSTNKRIRFVKYYLGFSRKNINASAGKRFRWRLAHPKRMQKNTKWERLRIKHALKRRYVQRREYRRERRRLRKWRNRKGFATWEGKAVPAWTVYWLELARREGWRGIVTSGIRTPAYSEHLCFVMCGRPSCPGRCAGRSSNHNMLPDQGFPHGCLDVSDYARFGQIMKAHGSPLHNALGAQDPVHFSPSGR